MSPRLKPQRPNPIRRERDGGRISHDTRRGRGRAVGRISGGTGRSVGNVSRILRGNAIFGIAGAVAAAVSTGLRIGELINNGNGTYTVPGHLRVPEAYPRSQWYTRKDYSSFSTTNVGNEGVPRIWYGTARDSPLHTNPDTAEWSYRGYVPGYGHVLRPGSGLGPAWHGPVRLPAPGVPGVGQPPFSPFPGGPPVAPPVGPRPGQPRPGTAPNRPSTAPSRPGGGKPNRPNRPRRPNNPPTVRPPRGPHLNFPPNRPPSVGSGPPKRPTKPVRERKVRHPIAGALNRVLEWGYEAAEILDLMLDHADVSRQQSYRDQLHELFFEGGLDRIDPVDFMADLYSMGNEDRVWADFQGKMDDWLDDAGIRRQSWGIEQGLGALGGGF